jgi:tetratricopeptide (TPR) repeat protein
MTTLSLLVACSSLAATSPKPSPAAPLSRSIAAQVAEEPAWVVTLRIWRTAVEDHTPGTVDAPVAGINAWSRRDLMAVVTDLVALRDLLEKRHAARVPAVAGVSYSNHTFTTPDIEALLGVTREEAERGDFNRLLKRGAMLHTDIATLLRTQATPLPTLGTQMLRSEDGRARGFEGTLHWEVARTLLDGVAPSPSQDEFVRSWYRATTAFLQREHNFAYADPHLGRAREIFPKDAVFLFAAGCLHEAYAAPLVQAVVRSADPRVGLNVGSGTTHWQRAEQFFREALASDSSLTEARLRLGRVIGLLGRHQEAIAELQRAVEASNETRLLYYGEMFLGGEERALGRVDAARAHFERAARLYPSAPSPYLALSDIAHEAGDRSATLGAIQHAFAVTADREHAADPWWEYHAAPFRNADDLLAQCRREFDAEKKQ